MAVSEAEVASRVLLLKRFRALLLQQRERFESYITVLDKQKEKIESGSVEDLMAHVELEEKIIGDIISIQKAVEPMRAVISESMLAAAPEAGHIASAIEALRVEAANRVVRNKDLLTVRMEEIRTELNALRTNPFARRKSPFASEDSPSFIDIKG
ncbi:MAG: flagellar biosynthesis protein FlgN [Spirochaetaceae bacterium]|jgi:hypothetical protein|nr:flagellar biosynthesis protein FlgN [Spirochaetaceae bacterium]